MNLGQGWNIRDKQLLRLRILERLAAETMSSVPNVLQYRADDDPFSADDYVQALQEFDGLGWLNNHQHSHGQLNAAGRNALEQIDRVRNDRRERDAAVHDALLAWVYDEALQGRVAPNLSSFITSPFGCWFGEPFTEREAAAASLALRDDELIAGDGSWGSGVLRPTLTPKGRRLARSGGSVSDLDKAQSGDTFHLNMGDNSNAQVAGRDSTQTMTVTLDQKQRDDVERLVASLRELATTNPDADAAADEVQAAAAGKDLGRLQRAFIGAQGAALAAVGADTGHQVFQIAHQLMQATH